MAGYKLYVSGYTQSADDDGILIYDVSADGRTASQTAGANGVPSPSFLAFDGVRVYAASETDGAGGLASYVMDANGVPHVDGHVTFPDAADTCFVLMHPKGTRLYGADYCANGASGPAGSVCVAPVNADGTLGADVVRIQHEGHGAGRAKDDPNYGRQDTAHVHTLSFVPGANVLAAVDLGLDLIALYQLDGDGSVQAAPGGALHLERAPEPVNGFGPLVADLPLRPAAVVEAPLYTGPRIVAYHPTQRVAAVVCELGCELLLYRFSEDGLTWDLFAQWDLLHGAPDVRNPNDFDKPPLSAHCAFTKDGRFLYASTRGTDTMTVFELDEDCHQVSQWVCSCEGKTPRHFALSPDERLIAVANQTSDSISIFARDAHTGKLSLTANVGCSVHPSFVHWA